VATKQMAALLAFRSTTPMDGGSPRSKSSYWWLKDVRTFKTEMLLAWNEI
jgi:hypothetical protein